MSRYQYKGYWVEIRICQEPDENGYCLYTPYVELPNRRGVIIGGKYGSFDEAEFATVELIESWN